MENLDILYEAFELYKSKTSLDGDVSRFKKFYSSFKGEKYEDIKLTFSTCTIETDWVEAIEKGLPFLEKAIKEERQFIRNDGEVLPIEKIRKVSKDSIQDLARHSNYITHEPEEGQDMLIPDKLLMIRKESDYAIYENRVLYATLVYLRDFVSSRLNKIKELTNRYEADAYARKKLDLGNRKLEYEFHIYETRNNDPIVSKKNNCADIIQRLDDVMANILGLLKRPLMVELAKVELVSRPITKTNVLRMNHNFRESLACFDYIANYDAPGYTITTTTKHFNPFSTEMMDSYGEAAILLSFLTYMYGNDLSFELRNKHRDILIQRKQDEEDRVLAKLKSLKAKAKDDEKTLTEYYVMFENGYRILEKRFENIDREIELLKAQHEKDLKEKDAYYQKELQLLEAQFEEEKSQINQKHLEEIEQINQENAAKVQDLEEKHYALLQEAKEKLMDEIKQISSTKQTQIDELNLKNKDLTANLKLTTSELNETKAKLSGLIIKMGDAQNPDELITEEAFDQLEKTKKEFDAYYNKAWKAAKSAIRKQTIVIKKKEKKK